MPAHSLSEGHPEPDLGQGRLPLRRRVNVQMTAIRVSRYRAHAANIGVAILTDKIESFMSRMKSGDFLSEPEQRLLASLTELKAETEASFIDCWAGA